jgi:hypothetical protein
MGLLPILLPNQSTIARPGRRLNQSAYARRHNLRRLECFKTS